MIEIPTWLAWTGGFCILIIIVEISAAILCAMTPPGEEALWPHD